MTKKYKKFDITGENGGLSRGEFGGGDTFGLAILKETEMEGDPLSFWLLFLLEFALFLLLWVFQVVENHRHKEIEQDLVDKRKVVCKLIVSKYAQSTLMVFQRRYG